MSNTQTVPGIAVTVGKAEIPAGPTTTSSTMVPFGAVTHLLSDKPLRRPNRTKPLKTKTKRKRRK